MEASPSSITRAPSARTPAAKAAASPGEVARMSCAIDHRVARLAGGVEQLGEGGAQRLGGPLVPLVRHRPSDVVRLHNLGQIRHVFQLLDRRSSTTLSVTERSASAPCSAGEPGHDHGAPAIVGGRTPRAAVAIPALPASAASPPGAHRRRVGRRRRHRRPGAGHGTGPAAGCVGTAPDRQRECARHDARTGRRVRGRRGTRTGRRVRGRRGTRTGGRVRGRHGTGTGGRRLLAVHLAWGDRARPVARRRPGRWCRRGCPAACRSARRTAGDPGASDGTAAR